MQSLTIIAEVADGIGMFGFAVAGLFASAGRRIDPVGVFVSVFTSAFGGGIIRDILLICGLFTGSRTRSGSG